MLTTAFLPLSGPPVFYLNIILSQAVLLIKQLMPMWIFTIIKLYKERLRKFIFIDFRFVSLI